MPISSDNRIEALLAHFRSDRSSSRRAVSDGAKDAAAVNRTAESGDRVEISLTANVTVQAVNGILNDSVVEQINSAIQEAGIDLTIEEAVGSGMDLTPEATARRIADFAFGFQDVYAENHPGRDVRTRISGFMSLIRGAIQEGFTHARDFLNGITKLSDEMKASIDRTEALTGTYLDEFQARQEAAAVDPATGEESA